ncbi:expressed unknown protein [Seminavis robusta]|uniref:Tudor domain-containing protein n=1 Tax=Seminavis robusta TaxID=568900 RepID=A0A9N8EVV8_9STRA|nr:expressed unknown protein [Seminavis robusta]|eukprot:Sro1975_g308800.1 n/a (997) ;mRNA; r:8775-11970
MNSTLGQSQLASSDQQNEERFKAMDAKTKQSSEEEKNGVDSLVSSLADKKRKDLDLLCQYLTEPHKQQQPPEDQALQNQKTASSSFFFTKKKSAPPAPKPFFLEQPTVQEIKTPVKKKKKSPSLLNEQDAPSEGSSSASWTFVRCLVLDLPLMLLFVSLAVVYGMRTAWTQYYMPIMERARRTDAHLLEEYTYYERGCLAEDVTKGFTHSTGNTTTEQSLDTLLQHGATTVPKLLRPQTIARLRKYLRYKNKMITDEEAFPMSQGHQRLSYGIEATEDFAISDALAEITSHKLLPDLLEQVLGVPDPALTEITAITSYYGAEDQVIHSDTKSDGYAGQFARTYAHTYSLFIPVQAITERMGVTQLCPGTHYCTNSMEEVCLREMIGVNQAFKDNVWKAGDGVLLNQQVWHGGSKHTDPRNNERILFIVSFTARPQLGKDHRQLARGTYFHMKWLMWGHTWSDIATDEAMSMSWPFNILRSLALWKPSNKKWGYDLLLSAALRATNGQNGMEAEDLQTFIQLKMDGLFHVPKWLQGDFSEKPNAWKTYVQETLDRLFMFLQAVNAVVLTVYLMLAVIVSLVSRPRSAKHGMSRLGAVLVRLIVTHGLVAFITWSVLTKVETSPWGSNIKKGLTFRRPFPTDDEFTSQRFEADPTVPEGPTTFPDRMDVLFGTRYDSPYLGSYNRWLDYHPGNQIFQAAVASRAAAYPIFNSNDNNHQPVLLQKLVDDALAEVSKNTNGGRILQQDHLSGDWVVLGNRDAMEMVRTVMATESSVMRKALNQQISYLVADYRFGYHRGTALAMESILYLQQFRQRLLATTQPLHATTSSTGYTPLDQEKPAREAWTVRPRPFVTERLTMTTTVPAFVWSPSRVPVPSASKSQKEEAEPRVGTKVMAFHSISNTWYKGTIADVIGSNGGSQFDILYEDGEYEENVSIRRLRKMVRLQEGVRVSAVMEDDDVYQGTVSMVYPSGNVDVMFDDGEVLQEVSPEEVDIKYPPF